MPSSGSSSPSSLESPPERRFATTTAATTAITRAQSMTRASRQHISAQNQPRIATIVLSPLDDDDDDPDVLATRQVQESSTVSDGIVGISSCSVIFATPMVHLASTRPGGSALQF